jgi:biotin carboxyl carrier protein
MRYEVTIAGKQQQVDLESTASGWKCRIDGREVEIEVAEVQSGHLSILYDGKSYDVRRGADAEVFVGSNRYQVGVADARSWRSKRQMAGAEAGPQKLTASMPGKIVRVLATDNGKVSAGQGVIVIEAMKMQNEIRSPREGTVKKILVREGSNVNAGETLAIIE